MVTPFLSSPDSSLSSFLFGILYSSYLFFLPCSNYISLQNFFFSIKNTHTYSRRSPGWFVLSIHKYYIPAKPVDLNPGNLHSLIFGLSEMIFSFTLNSQIAHFLFFSKYMLAILGFSYYCSIRCLNCFSFILLC